MERYLNFKVGGAFILLVVIIVFSQVYGAEIKEPLRWLLESGWLTVVFWGYMGGAFLVHQWVFASASLVRDSFIYKHFGAYADVLFGIATYGFAGSTSLSLLKGLYLQTFYEREFFVGFGVFDITSMFLLASFLLVYCVFNSSVLLRDAVFQSGASKVEVKLDARR